MLSLVASLTGWIFVAPLAALVPKRRDWIAVFGRADGRFLDNAKYFFLQAGQIESNLRIVFVTGQESVRSAIIAGAREAMRYPSWRAVWYLARCGTLVVDEAAWFRRMRFFLLIRARVIQLWHGFGFKWGEVEKWKRESGKVTWASKPLLFRARLLVYRVTGRLTHYAAVATTSKFTRDHVYAGMFLASQFPVTGYPRNDFARSLEGENRELAWSNVDAGIKSKLPTWGPLHRKLVLIAPTFRDSGSMPMQLDASILRIVDDFAEAQGVEFIFKFHPSEHNVDHIGGRHFHVCARDSDIYPVMPHLAALVTDYSSMSMDFLLVDKPLLFLIPEDDSYVRNDRRLQFDPRTMMPGPVVPSWRALLAALASEWKHDGFVAERAALRRKAFDDLPQAEAVPKLIALMRERGWVRDPASGRR
ncbi:MAG: CDP-glycerol glycerophosphotransferase family protein [Gammaproteobacteria bacterium]